MATLKQFLTDIASNPEKLGRFIHNPGKAMKDARLSKQDQDALKSGFPAVIYARLAGISMKKAALMLVTPPRKQPPLLIVFNPALLLSNPVKPIRIPVLPPNYQFQLPKAWGNLSGSRKVARKTTIQKRRAPNR